MRAWHYFMALTLFGETYIHNGQGGDGLGMPLITTPGTSFEEMRVPRATVRESWDLIIADLKEAEARLAGVSAEYRADEHAVKAFLGRVYVFTEDWANATTYLKDVIDNSGKSLMPFDSYQEMFYEDNFEGNANSESLFEITLRAKPGEGWGSWGPSTGSNAGMINAPTFLGSDGGRTSTGWGNAFPADENLTRFGFNLAPPTWVANPNYNPNQEMGMNNYNEMPDPTFLEASRNLRNNQLADPRLWVATRQVFEDSTAADGSYYRIWPQHETPWNEINGPSKFQHAWSFNKFMNKTKSEYNDNVQNGNNLFWLRLADIYLLYAEALIQGGGNQAEALEYINKVHRRAYGLPVDAPSAEDYTSLNDPTLATDPVLANNPLRYERYIELYGEGTWWWDVCRWKVGAEEAAFHQTSSVGNIQWDSWDYALPIPIREIETNPNLQQNPGFE
ncbi:MAG: RagB/SusD family nutrient uptake outer membrane protein [Bacteroidia bacterium]|nr:RagB/SusD family nutrient uptake outer membrane protein [Bacteroidia bacterium]